MLYAKFKEGQVVSFPSACTVGSKARKGGTITAVEKMYELKEENKTYYSNGTCRGDLTTQQNLSNGEFKGYAYRCKTIQPNGFAAEIVMVEEFKLKASTEEKVINSYTIYA
tara:strand:- start:374 stop:706 length:333 start_codon:yes stop_codon:yes gene_type:complete